MMALLYTDNYSYYPDASIWWSCLLADAPDLRGHPQGVNIDPLALGHRIRFCPTKIPQISRVARIDYPAGDFGMNIRAPDTDAVWNRLYAGPQRIRHPSQMYFLGEKKLTWLAGYNSWINASNYLTGANMDQSAHQKTRVNILFFDGHASALTGVLAAPGDYTVALPWFNQ